MSLPRWAPALGEWIWHDGGVAAAAARGVLAPLSIAYGAAMRRRNRRFDAGHGVEVAPMAAISVGNLTVGGTGKTPVAAWCVEQLRSRGGRPGLVLRGYGDDEWRVHELLNPEVPVIANPDRVAALSQLAATGADVAVLDDAFQHRRAARTADLVLVSADRWDGAVRLLPAGPWREPLASLRRASVVAITVKAASAGRVAAVRRAIEMAAPGIPLAEIGLVPGALHQVMPASGPSTGGPPAAPAAPDRRALTSPPSGALPFGELAGTDVLAISAIGDPAAFEAQLAALGGRVRGRRFPDHHAFSVSDVATLVRDAPAGSRLVCTLKDAVKLAPLWPRAAPPLWYVSQTIEVRLGEDVLQETLRGVLMARTSPRAASLPTAG